MPIPKLFVDPSAWVAICDSRDDCHQPALVFNRKIARKFTLVVTNYILDEIYTLLLNNAGYTKTLDFQRTLEILIQEGVVELIWITPEVARQAWVIFERFNTDKQWSFTDCTSYVVMQEQGITDVFTFDRHFSQMGFNRLP